MQSTTIRRVALAGLALAVGLGIGRATGPREAVASGHHGSRASSAAPAVDATGLYAFVSPDDPSTVTLIATWWPFQEPAGGPTFYSFEDGTRYEINIDNNGDAQRDIAFRWVFKAGYRDPRRVLPATGPVSSIRDNDLNLVQTFDLRQVQGGHSRLMVNGGPVAPYDMGEGAMPDYSRLRDESIVDINGGRTFSGPADDPFFADLRLYDRLFGGDHSEVGDDTLAGFNTSVTAVQIKKAKLARRGDPVTSPYLGIWATASRERGKGFRQVARMGMPLVDSLLMPFRDRNLYNGSRPVYDAQLLGAFDDPRIVHDHATLYGTPVPDTNADSPGVQRDDLLGIYFRGWPAASEAPGVRPSEVLHFNMSIPPCLPAACPQYSRLGSVGGDNAGWPNGRRLTDDVVDATLQLLMGEAAGFPNDLEDGVSANDLSFSESFPYVALPHRGSKQNPH